MRNHNSQAKYIFRHFDQSLLTGTLAILPARAIKLSYFTRWNVKTQAISDLSRPADNFNSKRAASKFAQSIRRLYRVMLYS